MIVGLMVLEIRLPGCDNLKEKRHRLKGVIEKVRSKFNVSAAETGRLDAHQDSEVSVAMVSDEKVIVERVFQRVEEFFANGNGLLVSSCLTEWF